MRFLSKCFQEFMFVVTLEVYKAHPLFPEMSDFQNENIDIAFGFRVRALKQMHLRQQYKAWISAKEDIQCLTIIFQSKNHRGIFFSSLKIKEMYLYMQQNWILFLPLNSSLAPIKCMLGSAFVLCWRSKAKLSS